MSSKINILDLLKGHFGTMRSASTGKFSKADLLTFYGFPISIATLAIYSGFSLDKDITSLLVNLGAIFTALLLSVLVLVYDQESKLTDKIQAENPVPQLLLSKKELLKQLFYNICYAIVVSILLVAFCLAETTLNGVSTNFTIQQQSFCIKWDVYVVSPIILFFVVNLMLTVIMIVKRMYTLLAPE